jgi:hypothetical protein
VRPAGDERPRRKEMPDTVEKTRRERPARPADPPRPGGGSDHADAARSLEAGLPLASVVAKLREAVEEGEGWAVMLWLAYYWGRPGQRARGAAMARRGVREATDEELAEVMRRAVGDAAGLPALAAGDRPTEDGDK